MAEPLTVPSEFDPLVEFYGMWNTELAEHYLPIPRVHAHKYECLGGYLIMSPYEGAANSYGEIRLGVILDGSVRSAGLLPYGTVNVRFSSDTWTQPDLTILKESARGATWVPADRVLMPIEFVSPSSRRRDRIDKPHLCAAAGVPWYLRVEINYAARYVALRLGRLDGDHYVDHATARGGQRFAIDEPIKLDFDPAELLEP
ncbi:Uma2 family endonuclease [Amycolatopsis anabasis]|uniref:Uma2 family endonuclease n=1 Tax=Amycolatopsis anabasis TaxID=1840409 RepID=UPI00131AFE5A|nr:Uma2 family endonuclease [Amycolatopsis anabasis]